MKKTYKLLFAFIISTKIICAADLSGEIEFVGTNSTYSVGDITNIKMSLWPYQDMESLDYKFSGTRILDIFYVNNIRKICKKNTSCQIMPDFYPDPECLPPGLFLRLSSKIDS